MSEIINVPEIFGKNVFNDKAMQERLPKSVYKKLKKTIEDGAELDPSMMRLSPYRIPTDALSWSFPVKS